MRIVGWLLFWVVLWSCNPLHEPKSHRVQTDYALRLIGVCDWWGKYGEEVKVVDPDPAFEARMDYICEGYYAVNI
jgi:hypothetical protein